MIINIHRLFQALKKYEILSNKKHLLSHLNKNFLKFPWFFWQQFHFIGNDNWVFKLVCDFRFFFELMPRHLSQHVVHAKYLEIV